MPIAGPTFIIHLIVEASELLDIGIYLAQQPNLTNLPVDKNYPSRLRVADNETGWGHPSTPAYESQRDQNHYFLAEHVKKHYAKGLYGTHPEEITPELVEFFTSQEWLLDELGRPLHPGGKTGIGGRGGLWQWGGRDVADAVVTRETPQNGLELLAIRKPGKTKAALPGGFVDPGEDFIEAAVREVEEETEVRIEQALGALLVHRLLTRSSRTTDHAWLYSSITHFHLTGSEAIQLAIGGDDADEAHWLKVDHNLLAPMSEHHQAPVVTVARHLGYAAVLSATS